MQDMEMRFTGSVPASYERLMVPLVFQPYADELARRACALQPKRILETAAGTGTVTRALHQALPDAEIVATDLNQPMLDVAQEELKSDRVRFAAIPRRDASCAMVVAICSRSGTISVAIH
jgi:ubiquinone/menaquinone biosynthesis C-methylase UbiE